MTATILPFSLPSLGIGVFTRLERAQLQGSLPRLESLGLTLSEPVSLDGEYEYFTIQNPDGQSVYTWREAGVSFFMVAAVDAEEDDLVPLASSATITDALATAVRHLRAFAA